MEAKYKMAATAVKMIHVQWHVSFQTRWSLHQFAHSFEWQPQLNAQSLESDVTARLRVFLEGL